MATTCTECGGTGRVFLPAHPVPNLPCVKCDGSGQTRGTAWPDEWVEAVHQAITRPITVAEHLASTREGRAIMALDSLAAIGAVQWPCSCWDRPGTDLNCLRHGSKNGSYEV